MTEMRDELLDQVVDELRTLPPVDELAVARIVRAVSAGQGVAQRQTRRRRWWRSSVPLAAAAGVAIAAGFAGFFVGDVVARRPTTGLGARPASAPNSGTFAVVPAVLRSAAARVPTQFILDAPRASHVALVGDFNGWDAAATPLARDPSSGIWTTSVALSPGRHVYAYLVNGTKWTLDPRAPAAQDPDFGTPSSVVLVGTP